MKPMATASALASHPGRDPHRQLKQSAHDLEALFLTQMFAAMRASVPHDATDPGEAMFTSMMDETIAGLAAGRSARGIGDALYRELARRLDEARPGPSR